MEDIKYSELDLIQKRLLKSAEHVMELSYNPYSRFYVGAALLTPKGEIITGTNVENAGYNPTVCAERAAIFRANAMGEREFEKIAVIARGEGFDTTEVTAPCGPCRQVLYEFSQISGINLEIIMSTTKKDKIKVATIDELLPLAFGPVDLGVDVSRYK